MCCSVLQCVACCPPICWCHLCHFATPHVLQCAAGCCSAFNHLSLPYRNSRMCCSEVHCVVDCCTCVAILKSRNVLHCVAVCCIVLQCVAMRCSVLQCVAPVVAIFRFKFPQITKRLVRCVRISQKSAHYYIDYITWLNANFWEISCPPIKTKTCTLRQNLSKLRSLLDWIQIITKAVTFEIFYQRWSWITWGGMLPHFPLALGIYKCVNTYLYIHTYVQVYMYIHTHPHMHTVHSIYTHTDTHTSTDTIIHSQQHTAKYCNKHQTITTRLNTVWTQCNTLQFSTLQYTAAHWNTLQLTATHCNTLHNCGDTLAGALQDTATHSQHYNTLQRIVTHCNTLQHTAKLL